MLTHTTKSNKIIEVYDDLYDYPKQVQIMKWALGAPFFFNVSNDSLLTDQGSQLTCNSKLAVAREEYIEKFELEKTESLYNRIKDKNLSRCWINASTAQHVPRYHPDSFKQGSITILYYINLKWDVDWDGHTVWRSDDLKEIEFVGDFTPGRVCVFDSSIPHKGTIPSTTAPTFRFTLNSVWE